MPKKGKVILAESNAVVREILVVSGFDSFMPISDDVQAGLKLI